MHDNKTWSTKGTYAVKVKAKDAHGAESDWETLTVSMPKNKSFIFSSPLITWMLEHFPFFGKILNQYYN